MQLVLYRLLLDIMVPKAMLCFVTRTTVKVGYKKLNLLKWRETYVQMVQNISLLRQMNMDHTTSVLYSVCNVSIQDTNSYRLQELQTTEAIGYCSCRLQQLQSTAPIGYSSYSLLQLQTTVVIDYCSYRLQQLQVTAAIDYCSYSLVS